MCDYSLQSVKSRPAKVGDKLSDGQHATVLQLPSVPTTEAEKEAQTRVEIVARRDSGGLVANRFPTSA